MSSSPRRTTVLAAALLAAAALGFSATSFSRVGAAPRGESRVFELRTYYTEPGRLAALNTRFREHTCGIFRKHGMELIGFWTPQDEKDGKEDKLVYILAFPSRDAARAAWKAFGADPEWAAARDASEKDGKIVKKVESVFLDPTDYSPIR